MSTPVEHHRDHRWHRFSCRSDFKRSARDFILDAAMRSINDTGRFRLVLSGGQTPRRIYQSLRLAQTDWSAWELYFSDERCLPRHDPNRNSQMAAEVWLDHIPIPAEQIHVIPAELGPERAAAFYSQELAGVGAFDLVLLGLGEDGHTASLFPGGDWEAATSWPDAIPVQDAPKPPPERVSLSPARLSRTRQCLFLITGRDKREAVDCWQAGTGSLASRILANEGVDVFLNLVQDSANLFKPRPV